MVPLTRYGHPDNSDARDGQFGTIAPVGPFLARLPIDLTFAAQ